MRRIDQLEHVAIGIDDRMPYALAYLGAGELMLSRHSVVSVPFAAASRHFPVNTLFTNCTPSCNASSIRCDRAHASHQHLQRHHGSAAMSPVAPLAH
jgi:hypothetical protein